MTTEEPTGYAAILAADADSVDDEGRPRRTRSLAAKRGNRRWNSVQSRTLETIDPRTGLNRRTGLPPMWARIIAAFEQGLLRYGRRYTVAQITDIAGILPPSGIESVQVDLAVVRAPFILRTMPKHAGRTRQGARYFDFIPRPTPEERNRRYQEQQQLAA
jgi:hypothetical protein